MNQAWTDVYICGKCWAVYTPGQPHACLPAINTAATVTPWWTWIHGVPAGLGATYTAPTEAVLPEEEEDGWQ